MTSSRSGTSARRAGCLPGGARPCRHHEFPCSGRKRRAGRPCGVRSRSGGRRDRGSRGSEPRRARSRSRGRRPADHASGSTRPNDCRGAGTGGAVAAPPPEPAAEAACSSRARRQPGAGRPAGSGGRTDGAGERERVGAGEQPRRRRGGRAGERRCGPVSAAATAVSGLDTGAGRPSSRFRRLRPPPRRPPRRRRAGTGRGNGTVATPRPRSRSRQTSASRTGPGTGTGIAATPAHRHLIANEEIQRSINLPLRSIGRSISTSPFESTVRATTAAFTRRTSQLRCCRPPCRSSECRGRRPLRNQPQSAAGADGPLAPLIAVVAVFEELVTDQPAGAAAADDCCVAPEPRGVAAPAPEPQSLLVPEAPPASKRDLTPQGRFRESVAVTMRLTRASEAAARRARLAPKPAQLHPAPRRSSAPAREQAAALSAAGFAPTERTRRQAGTARVPGRRVRVRRCFRRRIALGRRRGACTRRGS